MRYTFEMTNKLVFVFSVSLLLIACGYFENDGVKSQKHIVGNIYLLEHNNTDEIDLAHDEGYGMYAIVVSDCNLVYYDPIENRIYAERPLTEWSSTYYSLILKDPSSRKVWEAIEMHEILETTFKKRTAKKSCVQIKLR
ncbi:hypothetical protein [Chryseosolibacter indicus]|uniref:Lipoprotein n=1 Tax=Chryseosolibacter indicus TaxID=2782351 RepID=A0ABS5VVA8_9BACT|nr:hypothetical protein [Chryseosolibacter indicus]MBT1705146.1 hypothetical protein [Chryseosolibacter indicus]